ncbi:MAG TPA: tail fiber domain-containing protein, partial [Anaerolineae bacterium]
FTYQGQLKNNGSPVTNPACQMAFRLYDDPASSTNLIGNPITTTVPVANGLFTVGLNFGSSVFTGDGRWLDIQVNCGGGFVTLTPRQALMAVPYALALPGLHTEPNTLSPNVIGGYSGNSVTSYAFGATIGGGGSVSGENHVQNYYSTVGGGANNTASGFGATVPGGLNNIAQGDNSFAAGDQAQANHHGTFVWADSTGATFTSTVANQFLVRAGGGVGINTADTLTSGLTVNGRVIAGGTATGVSGGEPFVARGSNAGISLDDRSNASLRWVVYANDGSLKFWNGNNRLIIGNTGIVTLTALGSAGGTQLCRNAANQIATCSSSLRYKNNVAALTLGLDTVTQLHPVTFDWTGTGEHDLGFVAEQVDQVTPLLTTRNAAGQIEGVKYDRVSAVLVNAVQEQQQQIAAQQKEISDLQARLASLDPTAATASFNVFNLLSLIAGGGFIYLLVQQRRSQRGQSRGR